MPTSGGYYHGAPAIVMDLIPSNNFINHEKLHMNFKEKFDKSNEFWLLGKSYFRINISPKNEKQCGSLSCYEKSRATKKICKPGINKIKQRKKIDVNRCRRGLETCPQANLAKMSHAIFFSFFPTGPSDEYDSAENTLAPFSPVSVKV